MCNRIALAICMMLSSCQLALAGGGAYPSDPASLASGRELAEIHCASCHAVAVDDVSAQPGAPAFRNLSDRYPLESLEESLAEGIVTAHGNMPEIAFEPDDIDDFLGYLTSIQSN
ncbi:c-type cytochrome [Roseibium denhamense]|uniref:Cytochrome c n=1 Tax=Roseibium denhamense TaxID=76305 RepID=A0ABY1N5K9_9HYPH|nr:cytochrome c [Roseibium denhamense]SMP00782.1 Cytochrome c [Roseibium denhamense]